MSNIQNVGLAAADQSSPGHHSRMMPFLIGPQDYLGVCFAFLRIPNTAGSCSAEALKILVTRWHQKDASGVCSSRTDHARNPIAANTQAVRTYNTNGVLSHRHSRRANQAAEQKRTWTKVLAWTMCIVFFNPNMGNYQYMGSSHQENPHCDAPEEQH